jgi:hypothetical protein
LFTVDSLAAFCKQDIVLSVPRGTQSFADSGVSEFFFNSLDVFDSNYTSVTEYIGGSATKGGILRIVGEGTVYHRHNI